MKQDPMSVSDLNNKIKFSLESSFENIRVLGEASRVTYHSSGHIYFSIKDEGSSISCIMFRGYAKSLKFKIKEGMSLLISGSISVYTPRGSYQINCFHIEDAGSGILSIEFEKLKNKLAKKGYFDKENKKEIPKFIKNMAIITSKTSAALQDMLKIAKKRFPLTTITLLDSLTQGKQAASNIADNIKKADKLNFDVIVIARGGGSVEDLWAFNEEILADVIHEAKTPLVSAVGHELDFLISDFVADLRAPTPSSAMEIILPDSKEILIYLDTIVDNYMQNIKNVIKKKILSLKTLQDGYMQSSIYYKISLGEEQIKRLSEKFNFGFANITQKNKNNIKELKAKLINSKDTILLNWQNNIDMLLNSMRERDPNLKIKSGFAQVIKNNKAVLLKTINTGEIFELTDKSTKITAKAIFKEEIS